MCLFWAHRTSLLHRNNGWRGRMLSGGELNQEVIGSKCLCSKRSRKPVYWICFQGWYSKARIAQLVWNGPNLAHLAGLLGSVMGWALFLSIVEGVTKLAHLSCVLFPLKNILGFISLSFHVISLFQKISHHHFIFLWRLSSMTNNNLRLRCQFFQACACSDSGSSSMG